MASPSVEVLGKHMMPVAWPLSQDFGNYRDIAADARPGALSRGFTLQFSLYLREIAHLRVTFAQGMVSPTPGRILQGQLGRIPPFLMSGTGVPVADV